MDNQSNDREHMLRDALDLLNTALELLDRAAAPGQIGAYIDLAAHQLADALGGETGEAPVIATAQSAARH